MSINRLRRHYFFFGDVQGVGFRYHAKYGALDLGLTGWVKNCHRMESKSLPLQPEEHGFHIRG